MIPSENLTFAFTYRVADHTVVGNCWLTLPNGKNQVLKAAVKAERGDYGGVVAKATAEAQLRRQANNIWQAHAAGMTVSNSSYSILPTRRRK